MSENSQSTYQIQWQTVEHLKSFIESMKAEKQSVYIRKIKDLEDELKKLKKSKRYGLVWEDKPEDVVELCKMELPVLIGDETKTLDEDPNGLTHILIEWDNYHALSVLAYTHEKKVDIIYIDPPYNTGATDWKYNNDYVDGNDTFRHSKWLSMMNNRLKIAKKILTENGSLICAIDENEVSTITLLLQELFPQHEITCITVVHNPSGVQWKNFSRNNEYALFVYPRWERAISLEKRSEENADVRWFINWAKWNTTNYLRSSWPNSFYPIFVKNNTVVWFWDPCPLDFHPISSNIVRKDGVIEIYPITIDGEERKWLFSRNSVEEIIQELSIEVNKRSWLYQIIRTKDQLNYKTVWVDSKYNGKTFWTQFISKIINTTFPFPKSFYLVKECLSAIIHKPNAVILDFFAWSWTTGHAVLELNKEDGGNRQFILCTNNENKIAEEVTYPRIRNVIQGYGDVPGIPANLRYYRTDFIGMEKSIDDLRKKFMGRCTEMLQIRESCFILLQIENENEYFQVFESKETILAVLYHPYEIVRLQKLADTTKKPIVAYIFSMGMEIFHEELSNLSDRLRIETIPDEILETYKKIFGF